MSGRYPGYDVLAKRDTLSWNDKSREAVDARLATSDAPRFLDPAPWRTLRALAARIVPQPEGRAPIPAAAMVDAMLAGDAGEGYRDSRLPPLRDAYRRGLAAIAAEAGGDFAALDAAAQDRLIAAMQAGALNGSAWGDMAPTLFFTNRLLPDLVEAYYAHPSAWSAIGFGGPASPRGYVRLEPGIRDPWEAAEAAPGRGAETARENSCVR